MTAKNSLITTISLCAAVLAIAWTCHAAPSGGAQCQFSSPAALSFNVLDPSNPINVSAAPTTIVFTCARQHGGAATFYQITASSPNFGALGAAYNMQHVGNPTAAYIPYSMTFSIGNPPVNIVFPYSGSAPDSVPQTIIMSGSVLGSDYVNAYVGNYSDSLTLTITP